MDAKALPRFPRRVAALFGAAALTAGLAACGSEDSMEPTSETAFRAQDCERVEPSESDGVSVEGAVGWGDARRDIQEQESRCATEQDMQAFFSEFEEPEGEDPEPTRSPGGESGGDLPGFSVAAVDAAADGSLEAKPIERTADNDEQRFDRPTAGMSLGVSTAEGMQACTVSFLGERAGDLVGATAGHCVEAAVDPAAHWYPAAGGTSALGNFGRACDEKRACGDYGLIDVDDALGSEQGIGGRYSISGVMDPEELTEGMEVCKLGRVSGESCGEVMGSEGNMLRVGLYSLTGDSGSPAYVKKGDGSVELVGILSGSPKGSDGKAVDAVSDFTLAQSAIKALGIDRVL